MLEQLSKTDDTWPEKSEGDQGANNSAYPPEEPEFHSLMYSVSPAGDRHDELLPKMSEKL